MIGLPSNLFFGTPIPASLLIFRKNKKKKDILFIDASRDFEEGKNQNHLRETDIKKILTAYKNRKSIDKYAYLAPLKKVQKNEYNLNIPRYVDTFEEEQKINIKAVQKEIDQLEKELSQVQKKMKKHLSTITKAHLTPTKPASPVIPTTVMPAKAGIHKTKNKTKPKKRRKSVKSRK